LNEPRRARRIPAVGSPRQLQFRAREGHVEALRASSSAQLDCATFDREQLLDLDMSGDYSVSSVLERQPP
jgi:hypothetical protein